MRGGLGARRRRPIALPGAAGADQRHARWSVNETRASAKRLDAAEAVKDVAEPALVAAAREGVDGADRLRLGAEFARERARPLLERNREDEAVEILTRMMCGRAGVEILRQNVEGDQDRVMAAACQFRRHHLGERLSNGRPTIA